MKLKPLAAAFLLAVIAALSLAPGCFAESALTVPNTGELLAVFAVEDGLFCVLGDDKATLIDTNGNTSAHSFEAEDFGTPYAYFDGHIIIFKSECTVEGGEVFPYVTVKNIRLDDGYTATRTINGAQPREDCTFAFDGSRYYLMTPSEVEIYSPKMRLERSVTLGARGNSLISSVDGSIVYCACSDGVIVIDGDGEIRRDIATENVYPFGDKFSDDNSVVYDKTGAAVIFDGFDPSKGVAELDGYLIGSISGELTAIKGGTRVKLGEASESSFICASDTVCGCFTPNGSSVDVSFFTAEDIAAREADEKADDITDNNSKAEKPRFPYNIDENGFITGIPEGTTAAGFRRASGTDAVIKGADGSVKTGTLGTGMTVELDGRVLTIIITGDITGEGSVNSRDLRSIEDHLAGVDTLNTAALIAADLNSDGNIDLADAVLMYRRTKEGN